jgi:hypothetical protein
MIPVQAMMPGSGIGPAQIPFVNNPNALLFGGPAPSQTTFIDGMATMPTGFVFEGVRFFESTNLPVGKVNLTYTATTDAVNHPAGTAVRDASLGLFFGPHSLGVGIGGPGPEVLLNTNDDFQRFIIAIWRVYGAWALLNPKFVVTARTYGN